MELKALTSFSETVLLSLFLVQRTCCEELGSNSSVGSGGLIERDVAIGETVSLVLGCALSHISRSLIYVFLFQLFVHMILLK